MLAKHRIKEGDILLELEDIYMYFGKVCALADINLKVRKGEIHSVIGPCIRDQITCFVKLRHTS